MRAASLPPNWEDLVKNSSEIASTEDFELADTWTQELETGHSTTPVPTAGPSASRITDPFAIVPGQNPDSELSPVQAPSTSELKVQPSEGEKSSKKSSAKNVTFADKNAAASSQSSKRTKLNDGTSAGSSLALPAAIAQIEESGADPLSMPPIIDLEKAGLRRSARIAERESKDKETSEGAKVFGVSLFTALSTVGSITLPDYNRNGNENEKPSWADRCMTRFHEVNELYDGTCNQFHFMAFSTLTDEVASNEV